MSCLFELAGLALLALLLWWAPWEMGALFALLLFIPFALTRIETGKWFA